MTTCSKQRCRRPAKTAGWCKSHATAEADRRFSLWIRRRDGGRCMACGSTERLQCAHIVSRRYRATRWDNDNAVALCSRCHTNYTHHPLEWHEWVDRTFGDAHYGLLRAQALNSPLPDLADVLSEYEEVK